MTSPSTPPPLNFRSYMVTLAVATSVTLILDVLLNAVVFRAVYRAAAPYLRPADELNRLVPLGWGALAVIVGTFGWICIRGGWAGWKRGLEFGALLAVAGVAGVAGIGSVFRWPAALLGAVAVQQCANGIVLGLIFGTLYKPVPTRVRDASGAPS
jgi:hypothetical protein